MQTSQRTPPISESAPHSIADHDLMSSMTRQSTNVTPKQKEVVNEWDRYQQTDRSFWWKSQIKKVPDPGIYRSKTFIEELAETTIPQSSFKSDGRKRDPWIFQRGETLLPGAYNQNDWTYWLKRSLNTYSFKSRGRVGNCLTEGLVDKQLTLSPGLYNTEGHLAIDGEKRPASLANFRSKTRRLPSEEFKGKPGPDPGKYEVELPPVQPPIASSFQSKAPRFKQSHSKVPAPGTYERTYQSPMPTSIARLGRQHGLFFASSFY